MSEDAHEILTLFPTFVFATTVSKPAGLEAEIHRLREQDPVGIDKSNSGGWQSGDDLHRNQALSPLNAAIVDFLDRVVRPHHRIRGRWEIVNMWANINRRNDFNRLHIHGNCHFSGVFYVKVPKSSGGIVFRDPRGGLKYMHKFAQDPPLPHYDCIEQTLTPSDDVLFVFPAWLPHFVLTNDSDDERISVAFNVSAM